MNEGGINYQKVPKTDGKKAITNKTTRYEKFRRQTNKVMVENDDVKLLDNGIRAEAGKV